MEQEKVALEGSVVPGSDERENRVWTSRDHTSFLYLLSLHGWAQAVVFWVK